MYCTGGIFYNIDDNTVLPRLMICLLSLLNQSALMAEIVPLLHEEKVLFYREREVKAVSTRAQWVTTGIHMQLVLCYTILVYLIPMYYLAGLRPGAVYFFTFYFSFVLSMISGLYLGQLVAYISPNPVITAVIFPATTLALQVELSENIVSVLYALLILSNNIIIYSLVVI